MEIKRRTLNLRIKSLSEDGTFSGLLSPYGNVDDGGDLVEPGAYTKSLEAYGHVVPMLWQHKMDCPIGDLTLSDQPDGLYCDGRFVLEVEEAKKAYLLLKAGVIKGLSIGYETIKSVTINGVRHLKELRLYEGSVVTFPMNESAQVNAVKSKQEKGAFNDTLTDRQLSDAFNQMQSSLSSALSSLPWSGETREEILASADTILSEYTATYTAWLPKYLDFLSREYGLDTKSWHTARETKAGRKLSQATLDTLGTAHEHVKAAFDVLDSMLDPDPDEPDPEDEEDDETKSARAFITSLRTLLAERN